MENEKTKREKTDWSIGYKIVLVVLTIRIIRSVTKFLMATRVWETELYEQQCCYCEIAVQYSLTTMLRRSNIVTLVRG